MCKKCAVFNSESSAFYALLGLIARNASAPEQLLTTIYVILSNKRSNNTLMYFI